MQDVDARRAVEDRELVAVCQKMGAEEHAVDNRLAVTAELAGVGDKADLHYGPEDQKLNPRQCTKDCKNAGQCETQKTLAKKTLVPTRKQAPT